MTAKDPALLWYGSEFYEDERVLRMSYEQQGVYLRLLWIAQRNDGLPADPAVIAEMLQIPAKRFLARIWPKIAPCWVESEGRLRNPRQERDRARREATRAPVDGGDGSTPQTTRERMQQLARRRWNKRHGMRDADAAPHAHADASRIADADAADDAARNAASIPLPTPHPPISSEAKPQPHARADAAPHAASHPAAHAEGGASAARPAADPAPEPDTAAVAALAALQTALLATPYRSGVGNPFRRRSVVFARAEELASTGLTAALLADLEKLADEKGTASPGGLLAHWLDEGIWREVLDEQASKQKQRAASRRAATDPDQEPAPAAALVAAALSGAEPVRRTV